jgi:hypothetical protein
MIVDLPVRMIGPRPVVASAMRANTIIIIGAVLALLPTDANATYRDFCASVPSACVYTGPDAPVLAAVVCWSKSTSTATITSDGQCPTGTYGYFAKYGDVEPLTGQVQGYVPLDDACSHPGVCQPGYLAPANTTSASMCCPGDCWPAESQQCVGQNLLFCADGVSNEDGTVTCFDEEV